MICFCFFLSFWPSAAVAGRRHVLTLRLLALPLCNCACGYRYSLKKKNQHKKKVAIGLFVSIATKKKWWRGPKGKNLFLLNFLLGFASSFKLKGAFDLTKRTEGQEGRGCSGGARHSSWYRYSVQERQSSCGVDMNLMAFWAFWTQRTSHHFEEQSILPND